MRRIRQVGVNGGTIGSDLERIFRQTAKYLIVGDAKRIRSALHCRRPSPSACLLVMFHSLLPTAAFERMHVGSHPHHPVERLHDSSPVSQAACSTFPYWVCWRSPMSWCFHGASGVSMTYGGLVTVLLTVYTSRSTTDS